jgi:hypothetical protein
VGAATGPRRSAPATTRFRCLHLFWLARGIRVVSAQQQVASVNRELDTG